MPRVFSLTAQLNPQVNGTSSRFLYILDVDMTSLLAITGAANGAVSDDLKHVLKTLDVAIGSLSEDVSPILAFYFPDWSQGRSRAMRGRIKCCLPIAMKRGKVRFHEEESLAIMEAIIAYCFLFLFFMCSVYWILGYVLDHFKSLNFYCRVLLLCASGKFALYCLKGF